MVKIGENAFDSVALNANKYEIKIENYLLNQKNKENGSGSDLGNVNSDEFLAYKTGNVAVTQPHICTWFYLSKADLKEFLAIESKGLLRQFIDKRLKKNPRGVPRIIFRELMYTVAKFCKFSSFNLEQSGAVLSQFYLTHLFFTSNFDIGPEKLYEYFKNLQLCHSLPFPPETIKLFSLEEIKNIMIFFCKIYLRNLPLIRFMSLPNFTLAAFYHLEPEMSKKKKKDKKGKKKSGKKKKK